jgi:hypothetical protein
VKGGTPLKGSAPLAASDERLRQFVAAWEEEFGEKLTEGEARIRLHELVEFYLLVARPLPLPSQEASTCMGFTVKEARVDLGTWGRRNEPKRG